MGGAKAFPQSIQILVDIVYVVLFIEQRQRIGDEQKFVEIIQKEDERAHLVGSVWVLGIVQAIAFIQINQFGCFIEDQRILFGDECLVKADSQYHVLFGKSKVELISRILNALHDLKTLFALVISGLNLKLGIGEVRSIV